ncbi:MAG: guanitoxin biosynthesis heme-dependent pre-guanitoxin N-hydroxylase GntA [Pseudomonadota bacterium]
MPCPHRSQQENNRAQSRFETFVHDKAFPCVGAKAALVRGALETKTLGNLQSNADDLALWLALSDFAERLEPGCMVVQSFVVIFPDTPPLSETGFEHALWSRLQGLHYVDTQMGQRWSDDTSNDPASNNFSLSVAGESFFVIGLHPGASRPARRFDHAALVFNSNAQFEALRADGRYDQMKRIIRERDEALAGSINPMLKDFGQGSEAAQYSGRRVGDDWSCPFTARQAVDLPVRPEPFIEAAE